MALLESRKGLGTSDPSCLISKVPEEPNFETRVADSERHALFSGEGARSLKGLVVVHVDSTPRCIERITCSLLARSPGDSFLDHRKRILPEADRPYRDHLDCSRVEMPSQSLKVLGFSLNALSDNQDLLPGRLSVARLLKFMASTPGVPPPILLSPHFKSALEILPGNLGHRPISTT